MPYSILLVEDDPLIGQGVEIGLAKRGFTVTWLKTGTEFLDYLKQESVDIIVLDLQLPDMNGLQALELLRRDGQDVPVILATARDRITDRIEGLDAGADDYIVKPYSTDELAARIRAVGRRIEGRASENLVHGDLQLDLRARKLIVGNEERSLTPSEFQILQCLMSKSGEVVTLNHLRSLLLQPDAEVSGNTIQVHVHALRRKIGTDAIETIRGVGYMLRRSR